jgi:beta-N-acetylhexosaminidase
VLAAKVRVGLDRSRTVDLDAIADAIHSPESAELAQQVADHSVTLVRNQGAAVPLRSPEKTCFFVLAENRYGAQGQAFTQEVARRSPQSQIISLDSGTPDALLSAAADRITACESSVVAAFASTAAPQGNRLSIVLNSLLASGKPVTMVALGNPFLIRTFPTVPAYLALYSTVAPSEIAAVKALFGEIAIHGHLPVSIPDIAHYGEGIQTGVK